MRSIQITVKDVDAKTFQELKAAAVKNKMKVGRALTIAMHKWLTSIQRPIGKLSDFRPFKGGPGTEKLSERVDSILYES